MGEKLLVHGHFPLMACGAEDGEEWGCRGLEGGVCQLNIKQTQRK